MQIEHVQLFHLTASMGSISKAAQASHISQPALSQQIQRLEQELGFKLLERSNRGVVLTQAGQIVEKYAGHFVGLYQNLMEDLSQLEQNSSIVRIAATPVVGVYGLPCTMFSAKETFPGYSFHLSTAPSIEVEHGVIQGESDIGFINGPPTHQDELVAKKIYAERMVLVAGQDLEVPDQLDMSSLRQYPIVMFSQKSSLYMRLSEHLEACGHSLEQYKILFRLDSAESVKSSVIKGHGLAFLPYMSIKKELYQKQLREIHVDGFDMSYDIYIIYKKQEQQDTLYRIAVYFSKIVAETFC